MFAPEVLDAAVDVLARLAGSGAALEFAIGTGRVGIPLAARGVPVSGIELSAPMIAQLRHKVDEVTLPVVMGDMATITVPGEFSLVYLVWNSIQPAHTERAGRVLPPSATRLDTSALVDGSSSNSGCPLCVACRCGNSAYQ